MELVLQVVVVVEAYMHIMVTLMSKVLILSLPKWML